MREWSAVLGSYAHTRPLKDGTVASTELALRFAEYDEPVPAFKPMVMHQAFDVSELAIATFLQAREAGKPITLLPAVMIGGIHHDKLRHLPENGHLEPIDLKGKTLAVRAYSQTTGLWVRGILEEEYGIGYGDLNWVTTEGPHVEEASEPPFVSRAPQGVSLGDLLQSGEVAALVGHAVPGAVGVIPDAQAAQRAWFDRYGTTAVNHMVVVKNEWAEQHPELVIEFLRMLEGSHRVSLAAGTSTAIDPGGWPSPIRFGFENVRVAVELAIGLCVDQHLIGAASKVEELFPSFLLDS